ncbi:protein-cysteine N-palmitoyltransferase HHAT-like [Mytilus californianus]|uniref:protein-cysteine N-palmitoyltransferase HHAT-like n=1 Tax=Mytilus californianus TaxID=6549 RepID=UPI0022473E6E|nr:protein-cysteine N-palmitoyltransferase HHAT-like [Mytilus californianus]
METKKKNMDVQPKKSEVLPAWETYFYNTVHVSVVAYILYCVYRASTKCMYAGLLNVYDFETGWSFILRQKDMSNYEWHFFYNLFWIIIPWYIAYISLDAVAAHHLSVIHRRQTCLIYSLIVLTYLLGWKSLLLLCLHSVVMYLISLFQSKVLVWILSIALISTLNFEPFISWMRLLNPEDSDGKSYYMLMFTLALTHLRYTSFCLEHVECMTCTSSPQQDIDTDKLYMEIKKEIKDTQTDEMKFSLVDAFVYIFYFPLFFCGPIITYEGFSKQMNESAQKPLQENQMISIAFLALRMIFWAVFNEFILHFFYFNALQHNLSVIEDMDLWTLSGIGYCQGQFFMIKYTVMFGIPSVVARTCGIEPPAGPKCIGHIYTYSDMWKYFDRGMYSFIKRYIYLPLGGSQGNIIQKLLCSLGCFIFVYIWHGIEYFIFLWTLFNFIGISLEVLGYWIDKQTPVCKFKNSMPGIYRRIQGLAVVPLFVMSTFTAFCFFGGSVIGYMYYQKFIVKGWLKSWSIVIVVVYCCVQSSMEIHERQKMKKKRE